MLKQILNSRKKVLIICSDKHCNRQYEMDSNIITEKEEDITTHFLQCPFCKTKKLLYRTNRALEEKRKRLAEALESYKTLRSASAKERYDRLKAEYTKDFEVLNPPR